MSFVQNLPFFAIMLYLAGGVCCSVMKARAARAVCLLLNICVSVMMAFTLIFTLRSGSSYVYLMGHFPAPWGNELRIGPLEALIGTVFPLVMTLTLLGGLTHLQEDVEAEKQNLYFAVANLLMVSMLALIFTNDIFTAYVFVEINTIASCALVMINYKSGRALVATTRYLIMSLLGSGLFLIGIVILYNITGHLLMEPMGEKIRELARTGEYALPLTVTVGLFAVGMCLKSALWPFHSWLPDAHASATVSSSGILSGLVIKSYMILLIKLFYRVFSLEGTFSTNITGLLLLFGAGAMLFGSLYALRERDIKRMLAYSSVAQVGYIFTGIGVCDNVGMSAAFIQILVHAVTKPMLFTAAGRFMSVSGGSRKYEDLRGAGRRDMLAGIAFAVGSLSMIGVPFFAGFATKLHLTLGLFSAGGWKMRAGITALIVSTVLNALYYLSVIELLYSRRDNKTFENSGESKRDLCSSIALISFMLLNLLIGFFSENITGILQAGLSVFS